ncbi:acyltransferase family protein [uncultured Litoreibacter sp.]|uniref:acyltransferase family protein n=1 Tax=uncultured Litoreibacter sp. TaxID=1392394 RepID=UPI0026184800|nr:acyltransferase family protein [uncultured Litoreibacter sp.]
MRVLLLDNAKGMLIFLVVLGHYLEAINGWENRHLSLILTAIYVFHMPAFIFLAGMTSKREGLRERVIYIAIILAMFQLAYVVPVSAINGKWVVGLFQPYWILWFLLSFIFWTLLIPLVSRVPHAFAVSIAVAIISGFYPGDGYQFSIMRTLTFLPFFVGGFLYGHRVVAISQTFATRWYLAVAVLGVAAVVINSSGLHQGWLYGSFTYARLGFDEVPAALIKFALLVISSASIVAFLACVPTNRSYLSAIGENSLAIFALHGFFVMTVGEAIARYGPLSLHWRIALVVPISLVTTIVLANPIFSKTIRAVAVKIGSRLSGYRNS